MTHPCDHTESAWVPPGPALLFCPADRPDRYAKAAARADAVIIDLEDAVAPTDKQRARGFLAAAELDPDRVIVRVNPTSSGYLAEDLAAAASAGVRRIMLAKTQSSADLDAVRGHCPDAQVLALIETPLGAVNAAAIAAHPATIGLMWGAEDLVAAMGGQASRFGTDEPGPGRYRDTPRWVRAQVQLAAAAHGRFAIDSVHIDIEDLAGQTAEAVDAARLGFAATACIHPGQVEPIRAAYRPGAELAEWAERVLTAVQSGVGAVDGQMIDAPLLAQAATIRRRLGS